MLQRKSMLAGIALAAMCAVAVAQEQPAISYQPQADARFENGVILFNNGNYAEAYEAFSRLLGPGQSHQRLTSALLMRAKTSYYLKSYAAAERDLQTLSRRFPGSRYIEHARILRGMIAYQGQDLYNATKHFLWTIDNARGQEVKARGARISEILLRDYLDLRTVERLDDAVEGRNARALILWARIHKHLEDNDPSSAKLLIDRYVSQNPDTEFGKKLNSLVTPDLLKIINTRRLGVVLPLSGPLSEEGRRVYQGVQFASTAHGSANGSKDFELVTIDSEGSMIKAVSEIQKLMRDPNVLAVMGELDAFITAGLAGVAELGETPFVAPVTADNGLADIGRNVFQLVPDFETQATAMARHAIDSLGLRTFITFAPQDEYGRQMVDAFSAEVDRLGGEIMTQRWYYGVPENLGRQFKQVREIAFRRGLEDTLKLQIPGFTRLNKDSLWRAYNERVMLENDHTEPIVDLNSHYPVFNIDAVFLPIYTEDIKFLASQLAYYNIRARILGGDKWYNLDLNQERELQRYVNGAVFVSTYFMDENSVRFRAFRDNYRQKMRTTPEKWELLGYDAASRLIDAIQKGATSRSSMRESLASTSVFEGIKGRIAFRNDRHVNKSVHILRIDGSKYVRAATVAPE